jgi:hypothetical protein
VRTGSSGSCSLDMEPVDLSTTLSVYLDILDLTLTVLGTAPDMTVTTPDPKAPGTFT